MWDLLKKNRAASTTRKISDLFQDADRASDFSVTVDGMLFDYSKTNLDAEAMTALLALAQDSGVEARRDAMVSGAKINTTEDRAVLHVVARALEGSDPHAPILVDGKDVMPEAHETYQRIRAFAENIRSGRIAGEGGAYTDVVNIGIGGSDLGPAMAHIALSPFADGPRCHFVSNVDGADLSDVLDGLEPTRTLIIVASKTFTTQETLMNAQSALRWMAKGCTDPTRHFAALSTALDKTGAFGIPEANVFGFENWVGGRYSLWSPIGLSVMLAIGPENFAQFLKGGAAMDQHFRSAPLEQNMPVLLAMVGLWHQKICGYPTRAVIPYENRLRRLPAYLQQLEMESNGKSVAVDGSPLPMGGGPVVWGEPGTNGQHAFFQLLHQGSEVVPVEFIVGATGHEPDMKAHHDALLANCFAQSEALVRGRSYDEAFAQLEGRDDATRDTIAKHRTFSGNRPSTTLIYPKLTPFVLGQVIALYEHRVFVEGVVLGLNSFDQWGVELGKELANDLVPAVENATVPQGVTGSTAQLLRYVQEYQET